MPSDVWKQYYDQSYDGNKYENCDNCIVYAFQNELYVYKGLFHELLSGSISVTSKDVKFLHSACFFDACSRNSNGGAIYFNCQSSIIQHRFCTFNTTVTDGEGFHSYSNLIDNNIENKNYLIECSISSCSQPSKSYVAALYFGFCGVFSSNISNNHVYHFSGYAFTNVKGTSITNFSTLKDNYAEGYICAQHRNTALGDYNIYASNFINNSQVMSILGTVNANDNMIITNCTFHGSYGNGKPFSTEGSGIMIIKYCNVDIFECYTGGTFSTTFVFITKSLNVLSQISKCFPDIVNPICYYSCICYGQLNLTSNIYISLFVFLHIIINIIFLLVFQDTT